MEFEFEYEEKEQFTNEEVQAILDGVKGQVEVIIKDKDETITGLTTQLEDVEELKATGKELSIKNLMLKNNLDDDLFDLVADDNLEVVESKIEKLKSITKAVNVDGAFKPSDKKKDDDISKLEKDGNVEGMLKHKLNRLFG